MNNFANKVIWITGASSGIGEALAYAFSTDGAKLLLSSRRTEELERVKANCAHPENVVVLPLDLLDIPSMGSKTAEAIGAFGHVDMLIHNGGFVFADDCNHDIDGLFARSFETQMTTLFGPAALKKIPNNHPIYNSFFHFEKGPPNTNFELNGWGDDLVHDYLKAITINGRIGVLYSNKDYGCEWDYDFRNKRFLAEDNTKFGVNIILYALNTLGGH
jgi:hypothetical protein